MTPPLETLTLGVSETESVDTGAVMILDPAPFSLSLAVGVQEERRELRVNWRTDLERERERERNDPQSRGVHTQKPCTCNKIAKSIQIFCKLIE